MISIRLNSTNTAAFEDASIYRYADLDQLDEFLKSEEAAGRYTPMVEIGK